MPKDLTKLSLKDFECLSSGEADQRIRWNNGTLEMVVKKSRGTNSSDFDDEE